MTWAQYRWVMLGALVVNFACAVAVALLPAGSAWLGVVAAAVLINVLAMYWLGTFVKEDCHEGPKPVPNDEADWKRPG